MQEGIGPLTLAKASGSERVMACYHLACITSDKILAPDWRAFNRSAFQEFSWDKLETCNETPICSCEATEHELGMNKFCLNKGQRLTLKLVNTNSFDTHPTALMLSRRK